METPAQPTRAQPGSASPLKLVCFYLGGQEYGAEIQSVKETLTIRPITRVFLTDPWIAGIINLRGDILAVVDIAQLLGQSPTLVTEDSRILVAEHEGKRAGVLVDDLAELRTIEISQVQPAPATLEQSASSYLRGIATVNDSERERALRILNLPQLFAAVPSNQAE